MFPNSRRPSRSLHLPEVAEPETTSPDYQSDSSMLSDTEALRVLLKRNLRFEPCPEDLLTRIRDRVAAVKARD
jgi:hypothetical protein